MQIVKNEQTVFTDEFQDVLFKMEEESWWFQYRARVITELMNRFFDKGIQTIDIGGGNGYTTYVAQINGFNMKLLEPSPGACKNAKRRGLDIHVGMMTDEYPDNESYSQVLLLDVLEHIEDDTGFLKLLYCKMKKGGWGIISIPAFMCLWSSEDRAAGHFRRYRIDQICSLLESVGFIVSYRNYFMGFLFLPVLLFRVFFEKIGLIKKQDERSDDEKKRIMNSQFKSRSGVVGWSLKTIESFEMSILRKQNRVLFGSSIIVVVRKA